MSRAFGSYSEDNAFLVATAQACIELGSIAMNTRQVIANLKNGDLEGAEKQMCLDCELDRQSYG